MNEIARVPEVNRDTTGSKVGFKVNKEEWRRWASALKGGGSAASKSLIYQTLLFQDIFFALGDLTVNAVSRVLHTWGINR